MTHMLQIHNTPIIQCATTNLVEKVFFKLLETIFALHGAEYLLKS